MVDAPGDQSWQQRRRDVSPLSLASAVPVRRLSLATLADLPADVARPAYDPAGVSPGIVHLGVGAFMRAHLAVYTDDILAAGAHDWGIIGVNPLSSAPRQALTPQDGLYTVALRDAAGDRLRVVGSLREVLTAPEDPGLVLARMTASATRIVTLTVSEKGYCQDAATGALDEAHPAIVADLKADALPRSVPGLLTEAIRRRRAAGLGPFTVLVCDNLSQNGSKAHGIVTRFAALRDPELARFVAESVSFPNTMVDRITPATRDEDRHSISARLGLVDAWPVICEPFRQWVIEDRFTAGRPRWEDVGATLVDDVLPFEIMKLRCLNGTHSAMAYIGVLAWFRDRCGSLRRSRRRPLHRPALDRGPRADGATRSRRRHHALHRGTRRPLPEPEYPASDLADRLGRLAEAAAAATGAGA